ncbi:MAG: amidase [Mesorhizobium sp.]|uniref:amidase n=1 Tax=Mesorhizobium sp. TaxID=1871066 RepID=UPI000FE82A47|nr:amidase [Mesorhizobium sp.]RWI34663.1 MAG: amidase [Mesorhizobium sp.]RWI62813.1 MAG: amidase [Mesorhizobium sp.]RWI81359.1 MAG: amidase [Mesorhizobium sp.]RWJ42133.1 MAG: amidase [Mesorhizobium sp.]RWJ56974.1 MAG: amidase [Mesorhizobium sp.]
MKLNEYVQYDATGLARLVNSGEITSADLTRLARQAYDEINHRINAVIEFYEDAETDAVANSGLFNGVPFLRKDMGATEAGRLQERGSRLFKGHRSETDSFFFRRARAAGLRTIGRTTTSELAISGATETMLHGITRNPWSLERTAGGSSGGAAAAVAAGITPIAHGGDVGGSIRGPAAWCGVVGLNPSRGRVSGGPDQQDANFGLSRSFVLCQTVRDMAAALDVFSGHHPGDPFIIVQPNRPYVEELSQPAGTLRVGIARTTWGELDLELEVLQAVDSTASLLEEMGHQVTEIEPPFDFEEFIRIILLFSDLGASSLEASARAMGRMISADTLEPVTLKLYERGRNKPLSIWNEVDEGFRQMRFKVAEAIHAFDILLTPTQPIVAPPHGGIYNLTHPTISAEEWTRKGYMGCHRPIFNITGQPSVSLPLAQSVDGLPIGVQIVGRFGDEATLVRIARDLEEARPWRDRRPKSRAGNS